jgi:hypothetical protein
LSQDSDARRELRAVIEPFRASERRANQLAVDKAANLLCTGVGDRITGRPRTGGRDEMIEAADSRLRLRASYRAVAVSTRPSLATRRACRSLSCE